MRVFFAIGPTTHHVFDNADAALEFVNRAMAEGKSPGWGWHIKTLTIQTSEEAYQEYKESIGAGSN
jgi:hypothetical protein